MILAGKVLEKYYLAIILSLPMKDITFLAELQNHNLLSDNTKADLQSLSTNREMASYYVETVIKPELSQGTHFNLNNLLMVMMESTYDSVKEIASVVHSELTEKKGDSSLSKL